jgi:hypothetical protein
MSTLTGNTWFGATGEAFDGAMTMPITPAGDVRPSPVTKRTTVLPFAGLVGEL